MGHLPLRRMHHTTFGPHRYAFPAGSSSSSRASSLKLAEAGRGGYVSAPLDQTAVHPAIGLRVTDLKPSAWCLAEHPQLPALWFDAYGFALRSGPNVTVLAHDNSAGCRRGGGRSLRHCRRLRLHGRCRTDLNWGRACENRLHVAGHRRHRRRRFTHDLLRPAALVATGESFNVDLRSLGDRAAYTDIGLECLRWIKTTIITCDDDNEKHVGIAAGTEYVCLPTDSKLVLCRLWPHLYATELDGIRIFGRNTDAELCRLANVSGLIRQLGGLGSGFTPLFVAPSDHYSSGHGQVSYNRYGVDPHDTTSSMYASQYDFPR